MFHKCKVLYCTPDRSLTLYLCEVLFSTVKLCNSVLQYEKLTTEDLFTRQKLVENIYANKINETITNLLEVFNPRLTDLDFVEVEVNHK